MEDLWDYSAKCVGNLSFISGLSIKAHTLPINIRHAIRLQDGNKVTFAEISGQYVLAKPAMHALRQAQDAFSSFAEENDLKNEDVLSIWSRILCRKGM